MSVNIKGKEYTTVQERVDLFRRAHPDFGIITKQLHSDDISVAFRAKIIDAQGRVIATGHAQETRAASNINKTSAAENCETSAVGRALAFAGWSGSGEIASLDELLKAAINEFAQADTLDSLAASYKSWYEKLKGDNAAIQRIVQAKDNRKKELQA